jgi:hypothetical protein
VRREYRVRPPRQVIGAGSAFSIVGAALILFYGLVRNPLAVRFAVAAMVGLLFLCLLASAVRWVWEDRRRRRGVERMVGPEGRSYLPFASSPGRDRASLGPAFKPLSKSRVRGARRGARR